MDIHHQVGVKYRTLKTVTQGQEAERFFTVPEWQYLGNASKVAYDILMREHNSLGIAGGA